MEYIMTVPVEQPWPSPTEPYELSESSTNAIERELFLNQLLVTDTLSAAMSGPTCDSSVTWSSLIDLDRLEYVTPAEHPTSSPRPIPAEPSFPQTTSQPYPVSDMPRLSINASVASAPERTGKPVSRRTAHNRIEKRYRENLSNNFAALERTLQSYYGRDTYLKGVSRKQASRKMAILTDAVNYIEELQDEAATLRIKMQSLRQMLLPHGIWKYTLRE
ncbi:hypothetical protein BDV59DRAFT_117523 [Aspergillus ambiguus]|uniref:uncharacterized protein n=1 Tax=Aspergillus ambiguus TaxID=176160 RepID=UPI003CCCE3C8